VPAHYIQRDNLATTSSQLLPCSCWKDCCLQPVECCMWSGGPLYSRPLHQRMPAVRTRYLPGRPPQLSYGWQHWRQFCIVVPC
jgi:hypothetical protein